jgi:hypothetical protein
VHVLQVLPCLRGALSVWWQVTELTVHVESLSDAIQADCIIMESGICRNASEFLVSTS